MAQVKVDVDVSDELIDEATKKEIKSLTGQVARLKNKNEKLECQVQEGQELVKRAREIIEAVRYAGEFPEDSDY